MKSIFFGATALLLGGSALAAPAPNPTTYGFSSYAMAMNPQISNAAWTGAMTYDEAASWTGDKPMELTAEQIAEKEAWVAAHPMDGGMAAAKVWTGDSWAEKPADAMATGQGGPYEPIPVASTTSWPACDPGPGDDRCIQLYEPGVRGAFAQWSAGRSQVAMGGPYEPVTSSGKAMDAAGPTTEPTGVTVAKTAMRHPNEGMLTAEQMQAGSVYAGKSETPVHTGVGGPLEEVRDYPLCRSRSDDRCQQGS